MSHRERIPGPAGAGLRRSVLFAGILSVVATLAAIGALAVVAIRWNDPGRTGGAETNSCRTVTWSAIPRAAALPSGWTLASTRFLVDIMTTTLVGPTPSGASQGPATFVSVSCYGSDAQLALARDHSAALLSGASDASFRALGDEKLAVTSARTGSTTVFIRRGILVADIETSTSIDPATLDTVAAAVDDAMTNALSANPVLPSTPAAAVGATGTPAPAASVAPSASPSPTPAPVSHVAPDLEALLPRAVDGTALTSQSVVGTTVLGTDVTSQSLIASLTKLGKTPADLEVAAASDPTGTLPVRLLAFRVKGAAGSAVANAIIASSLASTAGTPVRSDVTIAGRKLTKVSFAQGPADYIFGTAAVAFDIETTDESLVAKVLALLK